MEEDTQLANSGEKKKDHVAASLQQAEVGGVH